MKLRKIISIILAVVIVTACYTVFELPSAAISTASALKSYLQNGQGFTLDADIDMSGQSVVTSASASGITVNGNGHVIKNMTMTKGLYASLSGTNSISNLALYNCTVVDTNAANGNGYGLIAGKITGGTTTITNCFADGPISIGGSYTGTDTYNCYIGGFVGHSADSATLNIDGCVSLCEIHENISIDHPHFNKRVAYIGGFVGYHGAGQVGNRSYTTGTIDNAHHYHYVGGMVGYSKNALYTYGYTSLFIEGAYADNVKSIGNFENPAKLNTNVYYDKTISLQRQEKYTTDTRGLEQNASQWSSFGLYATGFYPRIDSIASSFPALSAISTAKVDLNLGSNFANGTGRDYFKVSATSAYTNAILSNDPSLVTWHIKGGLDEYYFNPDNTTNPTQGGDPDGLSGNTYDTDNGKYLFVTAGDISFTAENGGYSRTITIHARNTNPYIASGSGTQSSPFLIKNQTELDYVRLYCLTGDKYFKVNNDITLSGDFMPISDFCGNFNGNGTTISGLSVKTAAASSKCEGLFGNISGAATISDLFLKDVSVSGDSISAGGLAGKVDSTAGAVSISGVIVSGDVRNNDEGGFTSFGGMLIGDNEDASLTVSGSATMGLCYSEDVTGAIGGIVGKSVGGSLTDCYSTAAVANGNTEAAVKVGGLIGDGAGGASNSLFTGMLYNPSITGTKSALSGGAGTMSNCQYDKQSVGFFNSTDSAGKTTVQFKSANAMGGNWTAVSGKYPRINALNTNFPEACALLIEPVNYAGSGNSRSFTTATIATGYTVGSPVDLAGNAVTNYTYSGGTFTCSESGLGIYSVSSPTSGNPSGTRILLFNVKGLRVYYRFVYDNSTTAAAFKRDMSIHGLVTMQNQLSDNFNLILDANQTAYTGGYGLITNPTDAITYIDTVRNTIFYNCTVTGGLTPETVGTLTNNTITFNDATSVYIDFNISTTNVSLWGIYFSNTTN